MKSILETIENSRSTFTDVELGVLDYMLKHQDELKEITINDLAKATYSSNATIIRICRKLGFDGYRAFVVAFLVETESHRLKSHDVDFTKPFDADSTGANTIEQMYSLYIETIQEIRSAIPDQDLIDIAQILSEARRIFIFAAGDTSITARVFMNKMLKINMYPILAAENREERSMAHNLTSDDVALYITYSGVGSLNMNTIDMVKESGAKLVVITANDKSPLLISRTKAIVIPDKEKQQKIATFYSQIAFGYILNTIYALIFSHKYDDNKSHTQSFYEKTNTGGRAA